MQTKTMRIVVAFLLITINVSFCKGSSYMGCIKSERQALLRFKKDLIDPMSLLASWSSSHRDCCTWSGIVCNNLTGHVLELNLRTPPVKEAASPAGFEPVEEAPESSKLGGKINPSLLDLKHLRSLDLSDHNFEGIQIPRFLGSMHNLRYLNLSLSDFQGVIPQQIGNLSNLQYLALGGFSDAKLHAKSLWWLSRLSLLKHLDLSGVDLTKSYDLFEVIKALPSLVVLKLSSCGLHHFPPQPIANFSSLATLDLSLNHFEGPIPDGLQNLTSLINLDLSYNHFSSSIPDWLNRFSHLEDLFLQANMFEGGIPKSMGRLCNLRSVSISGLNLSQSIYEVLDIFSKCASDALGFLDLSDSQLFGQLTNQL
ncbi:receptor-like protein EIX2 [Pistacia vera]|uniref:receptor-like protein EIX2 n=1 Tax=Pistacia vera TaxID=55513 RepID=UPI001262D475|nr:receptor-like protein EIX2 [Pistacia vera]